MEPQWQEQFAVVAQCVYTVIWDYNEKRTEIIDHLLENRTISGPRARNWQSSSDTKAYALELRIRVIQDILSTLVLNDPHDLSNTKRPAVHRTAIPPMFQTLVGEIQSMQGEVSGVDQEYSVDCIALEQAINGRCSHSTGGISFIGYGEGARTETGWGACRARTWEDTICVYEEFTGSTERKQCVIFV
jgi:hypothetical protein